MDNEEQLPGVTELEDGSAVIEDLSPAPEEEGSFGDNLAETLSPFELNTLATQLLELIERDKEARKERDKQQEEGIRRTGLGNDAPGGATFDGASKVVHPVLAEGCIDFSARAIKELFPSAGPVRTKILGEASDDDLKKAKSKRDFLNFYLTERMPEYRDEKETLLTQLPLGGSQYEKYWFDGKRIRMEFTPIDKVLLPYAANSFYNSPRMTVMRDVTEEQVERDVESGFYRDVFDISSATPEETSSQSANNKIEGKTDSGYNEDGVRIVYEITCMRDIEGEGLKPYVVHIDEPTSRVAAIYRNWKESDEDSTKLDWMVEDKFIPWRGAYGIGFPHLIGGLAGSLTGALRALLDSAHINTIPTAIKLKGGRNSGQSVSLDVTAVTEIDNVAGVDDIRKLIMPMPFNQPSPVLLQLLDWITNAAKGVVATAEERIADAGNNMPVGTTLALIEQGSQVFSSIHARLHESQRRALRIICRLLADYPEHALADMGRFGLVPEDFLSSNDIEPVSDPNIFSESQRFAQIQAVMQLAASDAQDQSIPWNKLAIRRRMLDTLRIDGADELLPAAPEPLTADPATENVGMMQGKNVLAVPPQDHDAHIKAHLMFILQPFVAKGANVGAQALSKIMDHVSQHQILEYQSAVQACAMQVEAEGGDLSPDQMALKAVMLAQERTSKMQEGIVQLIAEAMKIVQSKVPPPPVDPGIQATKEVAMAQLQLKAQTDQASQQLEQQKLQATAATEQVRQQLEQQKLLYEQSFREREFQAAPMLEAMKREFEAKLEVERMQREDQAKQFSEMMANQRNEADNRQHQLTELLKNRDDNETAIQIARMKQQGDLVAEAGQLELQLAEALTPSAQILASSMVGGEL